VRKILHVEIGGSYGGSLRALELYLANCDVKAFQHDLLFYYPTPGAERLAPYVGGKWALYPTSPPWLREASGSKLMLAAGIRSVARLRSVAALRSWASVIRQLPTAFRLALIIRRGHYDMVHVNNTFTYQIPTLLAATLAGVPLIAHVRNPVPVGQFARFFARRAKCLVSVAEVNSESLRKMDASLHIVTCHDAIEAVPIDPQSAQALRRSLVNDGELLVGSLGRLDPQKGFEFLIQAASLVVAEAPNVRFAIAGEGAQRKQLEDLIRSARLGKLFRLVGFRSDSANFLAALDIFVCPSLWEGGPLTVLEAMRLARAVVSTPVGIVPEVVRDRVNGLLVPSRDIGKLTSAILELVRDPELRSRLGTAAPKAVEPFCDLEARAGDLDSIFLSNV
jgi:glycosyltransferase involved in cell wall biosynthesis